LVSTVIVKGTTDLNDCTTILLDYFPPELNVRDLDAFSLVCTTWLDRVLGGAYIATSPTTATVLQRMTEGAKAILITLGSSHFKLCEGEGWIHRLWLNDVELIPNHGALFRELLYVLAECYRQRAFAGDQTDIRKYLHRSLMNAHLDLGICEQPGCLWLSHKCKINDWGRGDCDLLPEHGADSDEVGSRVAVTDIAGNRHQPTPRSNSARPSSGLLTRARGKIAFGIQRSKTLVCGAPAAIQPDVEQGHMSENEQNGEMEMSRIAVVRSLEAPVTGSSAAADVSPPSIIKRSVTVPAQASAVHGAGNSGNEGMY
jgi:hypothetical protein